jgi:transposase
MRFPNSLFGVKKAMKHQVLPPRRLLRNGAGVRVLGGDVGQFFVARGYIPVDRGQQFLIPPDMRDWLGENHLVWWLLEVVDRLDTTELHRARRRGGVGRAGYDPDMLLALLVYAYCTKVRSSRQIERLCETDVAYRVICAGRAPDHSTIARFRQEHARGARRLFADVLEICAQAGLAQVGVVAVDGTKIAANASRDANRSRERLEAEIAVMFDQAQRVDDDEDDRYRDRRGDELPDELADPDCRKARLQAALDKLAERDARRVRRDPAEAWTARVAYHERRVAEQRQRWAAHRASRVPGQGMPPRYPQGKDVAQAVARLEAAKAKAAAAAKTARRQGQVNLTDPDSRLMPTANGWVQGYNAQAAVNEVGIVVAAEVFEEPNDVELFNAMIDSLRDSETVTGPVGVVLADAGYCSKANLSSPGPTRLIATASAAKTRNHRPPATTGPPPAELGPLQAMSHTLRTPEGRRLYKQRSWTVEPGFGNLKANLGFTRFSRRGRPAVQAEWHLITAAANLLKLYRWYPGAIRLT